MKIGVYICECGVNIASTVDVPKVVEQLGKLENVATAKYYKYMCSEPGQALIKKDISELGLDRVIVASCSPTMHEPTFREVCREATLNPYCFEMVNIREQCSWVHEDIAKATEKATALIAGTVKRAALTEPLKEQEVNVTQTALVIGAGIAGMQTSLEIAKAGFKVYLVEKEPSIGGRMAQLDKTFPTLDCSSCILTPKMAEVARNKNIKILAYSEIADVKGYVGNFKVKVKKKATFVDWIKCSGCDECTKRCPVELKDEFNAGLSTKKSIYRLFPQAVPNKFTIDKKGISPCRNACPAGVNAQGYTALISQGKFKEALAVIRERNPFPGICGRICNHPCEEECNRKEVDEPIAIAALKRFIADWELMSKEQIAHAEKTKKEKIAVIGSGPAGLTCAYYLTRMGYQVTVFEALPVAGGMLAVAIPEYRLPKKILQAEIDYIKDIGVEIKTNTRIESLAALKGYDAVFIATGAHESRKLKVPGEELKGVVHGVSFLRELNLGKKVKVGNRVAVVGGGNVAIDSARAALRLGAKEVFIVYRRSRAEMPANDWEIEEAEEEGVKITYLVAPAKLIGKDGKVAGIECMKMELGEPDETGRRKPVPIKGSEYVIDVDMVIPAIGQEIDTDFLKANKFVVTDKGTLQIDLNTFATNIKGIFAGGDLVRGPATAVEVIADCFQAAVSIDKYLRGESLEAKKEERHVVGIEEVDTKAVAKRARAKQPQLPVEKRIKDFSEVNLSLTEQEAIEEAKRCLNCAVCSECKECEKACEPKAIVHEQKDEFLELKVGAIIVATGFDIFDASLKPEYGYGKYQEVITGLEFERFSSASGPTSGEIIVNGKKPKKAVFIQCVGSRDKQIGNEYCSRVCCMYTAKQAHLIKEKIPDCDIIVCYTDVRAFGKGFEEFYDRVKNEGVIYRRGNVGEVYKKAGKLIVRGEDTLTGTVYEEETDLVVLAAGLVQRKDSKELGTLLRTAYGIDGFFLEAHPKLRPVDSRVGGIFLAGCCQAPKDIPDTVAQSGLAAAEALGIISNEKLLRSPAVAVVDEIICRGCGKCIEVCEYKALELKEIPEKRLVAQVNPAVCEGCGACSAACCNGAITVKHFANNQIIATIEGIIGGGE